MAFCSAVLIAISVVFDAPIERPADPNGIPPENVKAPWIFLGVQQALKWMPAEIAGVILPVIALITLTLMPYLRLNSIPKSLLFAGTIIIIVVLTVWGYVS